MRLLEAIDPRQGCVRNDIRVRWLEGERPALDLGGLESRYIAVETPVRSAVLTDWRLVGDGKKTEKKDSAGGHLRNSLVGRALVRRFEGIDGLDEADERSMESLVPF